MNKDSFTRVIMTLIAALMLGSIAWRAAEPAYAETTPSGPLFADRQMGDPKAPVKIYEYSSLTCPHCAAFYQETFPKLKADYIDTGKVLFVSRDYPFDKPALEAAEMARCIEPDRYFALVDTLFKSQKQWGLASDPVAALKPLGKFAGMSDAQLNACFANTQLETFILSEVQQANDKYQVSSTPTFIFNDGADKIDGAVAYEKFKAAIDTLLAKQ